MDHENEKEEATFLCSQFYIERERETYGNKARGLVMLHAKVGTRLVAPFKGIQLCSACECLLNRIN